MTVESLRNIKENKTSLYPIKRNYHQWLGIDPFLIYFFSTISVQLTNYLSLWLHTYLSADYIYIYFLNYFTISLFLWLEKTWKSVLWKKRMERCRGKPGWGLDLRRQTRGKGGRRRESDRETQRFLSLVSDIFLNLGCEVSWVVKFLTFHNCSHNPH